jgi:hypothetical protein
VLAVTFVCLFGADVQHQLLSRLHRGDGNEVELVDVVANQGLSLLFLLLTLDQSLSVATWLTRPWRSFRLAAALSRRFETQHAYPALYHSLPSLLLFSSNSAKGFDLAFVGTMALQQLGGLRIQVVIGYHAPSRHVVVSYSPAPGPNDARALSNLLQEKLFRSVSRPFEACDKCFLADSLLQSFKGIVDHDSIKVIRAMRDKYPDSFFLFTGHSVGAVSLAARRM